MGLIKLTREELGELEKIAIHLWDLKPELFQEINSDPKKKINTARKLAAILGYNEKTIYEVIKSREISDRSLKVFSSNVEKLTAEKNSDAEHALTFIERLLRKKELASQYANDILHSFENTAWYIYSRSADSFERMIIKFGDLDFDKIPVIVTMPEKGMFPWQGFAYTDATKKFLSIQTFNRGVPNALPTNYLIRINDTEEAIDICIGHMTFVSQIFQNVVTKTIVLEKVKDAHEHSARKLYDAEKDNLKPQDMISSSISRYLNNEGAVRLTTPHSRIITNINQLEGWLNENEELKRDARNVNIPGEYQIFYKRNPEDKDLTDDKLDIRENSSADLEAFYFHKVDKEQQWKGSVSYSPITRAIFIALSGPLKKNYSENISSIFIILNLPSGERDFEVLTGIISGIRDNYDGSIGLLVVAVKKSKVNKNSQEVKNALMPFFNRNADAARIMTPSFPVAKFEDLQQHIMQDPPALPG